MSWFLLTTSVRSALTAADPGFDRDGSAVRYIDIDAAGTTQVPAYDAATGEVTMTQVPASRAVRLALVDALTAPVVKGFAPVIVRDSQWDAGTVDTVARAARAAGYQVAFLAPGGQNGSPSAKVPTLTGVPETVYKARVQDWSVYRRVIVVGDVQGCGTALRAFLLAVDYSPEQGDHLVYLGDLFDRGTENPDVYRVVSAQGEADIILGNHDRAMRRVTSGDKSAGLAQSRASMRQFAGERIYAGRVGELLNRCDLFIAATFAGRELWFSHGGVASPGSEGIDADGAFYHVAERPGRYFINGVGESARTADGRSDYSGRYDDAISATMPDVWHFHGHRSRGDAPHTHPNVWNLETRVEFDGGTLSGVVISRRDGQAHADLVQVPNPVTCGPDTRPAARTFSDP